MYTSETSIRVRYAETDRMGYVYYGNYPQYYEVARVEALRQLGLNYKQLEDDGILLPVIDLKIQFFKPAYYDEILTIKTTIPEMPLSRIRFTYELYNQSGEKLNQAETTLVFVNATSRKPCRAPVGFINKIQHYFG